MEEILDRIYEAAVLPEKWRAVIAQLSDRFQAKGGLLFTSSPENVRWLGAGEAEQIMHEFLAEGWAVHNDRVPRLIGKRYPGFVTDLDVYSAEEIAARPMYTEFLIPRGVFAATATAIQGATDDMLILSIEGHADYQEARSALPYLDSIRPHLARSAMLASQMHLERANAAIAALQVVGAPAAFVTDSGRLVASNRLFQNLLGREVLDHRAGLKFTRADTNAMFNSAIAQMRATRSGRSIPLLPSDARARGVLHILPICGSARDIFTNGGAILVVAGLSEMNAISQELLQGLFDLTPAEARLARVLFEGLSPAQAARRFNVAEATIRTQLKALFAKTGQSRQVDLVRLLSSFITPVTRANDL